MVQDDKRRLISSLEIVTGIGFILFWVAFFTVGLAPDKAPPCYFAHELSFPLPDSVLATLLLVAGILLMKSKRSGRSLSLVAAGALIFLGLLDFSFNLQNGIYLVSTIDLVLNAIVNVWCVGFGLALAILLGKNTHA